VTAAPSNPFDLASHLIDDHHQAAEYADQLDADELRAYHLDCHRTGLPDHHHED
jgi:hypothetical protein